MRRCTEVTKAISRSEDSSQSSVEIDVCSPIDFVFDGV
jgi:hypothetical protein